MTLVELLRQELPKRGGRHEVSFRPLRTEAERAIEEMVRLLMVCRHFQVKQ